MVFANLEKLVSSARLSLFSHRLMPRTALKVDEENSSAGMLSGRTVTKPMYFAR